MATNVNDYKQTKYDGIAIHKKDDTKFLIRFYIDRKRTMKVWKSNINHTKRDRLKNAYAEQQRLIVLAKDKQGIEADLSATVDDYFQRVIKHKRKLVDGWSDAVADGYEGHYDNYIKPIIGDMKIADVKPKHITKINEATAEWKARTRKKSFEVLKPVFDLAIEDEVIEGTPVRSGHLIKRSQKQEKKVITNAVSKYKAIHKAIMTVYADDPHHRALHLFGFYGRRKGEVLQLEWSDIDLEAGTYTVRGSISKSGADRTYDLSDDLKEALLEFEGITVHIDIPDDATDEQRAEAEIRMRRVFHTTCINRHMTKLIRDESKVPEYTYHWMRNLSVSALSANGVDSAYLSGMLGHTDLNTVKQYLTVQNTEASAVANAAAKGILS